MKLPKLNFLLVLIPMILTACLKTRGDVKESEQTKVQQQQVVSMQKAEAESRQVEIDEEMRNINGRIETLENKLQSTDQDKEKKQLQDLIVEQNKKMLLLQEALAKLETQVGALNSELQNVRAEKLTDAKSVEKKAEKKVGGQFEAGLEYFGNKDWKRSILSFQKYRDENPNGAKLALATLYIGDSFKELGMKDESKSFYDEVVAKYPKTAEAKTAKSRLKALKK